MGSMVGDQSTQSVGSKWIVESVMTLPLTSQLIALG